jgi:hypothetical protein
VFSENTQVQIIVIDPLYTVGAQYKQAKYPGAIRSFQPDAAVRAEHLTLHMKLYEVGSPHRRKSLLGIHLRKHLAIGPDAVGTLLYDGLHTGGFGCGEYTYIYGFHVIGEAFAKCDHTQNNAQQAQHAAKVKPIHCTWSAKALYL